MVLARPAGFKPVGPVCKTGRRFDSPCPLHIFRFGPRVMEPRSDEKVASAEAEVAAQ
jgi:hypothetical protein